MIADKLDFLMKLTDTQNSTLGKVLNFDASYISRIRNGKRGVPKHQPFIEPAAAYFAHRIRKSYQQHVAAEMICPSHIWPQTEEDARLLLIAWLSEGQQDANDPVHRLLSGISDSGTQMIEQLSPLPQTAFTGDMSFFYGNEGKRKGVELFLSRLCMPGTPQTLLLYSDEDMSWLYEDAHFAKTWASLLVRLISQGCRIKIIHTISRDINDMLEAIQKWIPLYMTGAIEPYFYPKIRDDVYHRTLFIAHDQMALISNSVFFSTQDKLNLLLCDQKAVSALEGEFYDYLALCRPLVHIYRPGNTGKLTEALTAFGAQEGNFIAAHSFPSFFTLPLDVCSRMADRSDAKWLTDYLDKAQKSWYHSLKEGRITTEILHLPDIAAVKDRDVFVPLSDLLIKSGLVYRKDDLRLHLLSALNLLQKEENYRVLISDSLPSNISLFAKEDGDTFMCIDTPPCSALAISEQRMSASFYEYLLRLVRSASGKDRTIRILKHYISRL